MLAARPLRESPLGGTAAMGDALCQSVSIGLITVSNEKPFIGLPLFDIDNIGRVVVHDGRC